MCTMQSSRCNCPSCNIENGKSCVCDAKCNCASGCLRYTCASWNIEKSCVCDAKCDCASGCLRCTCASCGERWRLCQAAVFFCKSNPATHGLLGCAWIEELFIATLLLTMYCWEATYVLHCSTWIWFQNCLICGFSIIVCEIILKHYKISVILIFV